MILVTEAGQRNSKHRKRDGHLLCRETGEIVGRVHLITTQTWVVCCHRNLLWCRTTRVLICCWISYASDFLQRKKIHALKSEMNKKNLPFSQVFISCKSASFANQATANLIFFCQASIQKLFTGKSITINLEPQLLISVFVLTSSICNATDFARFFTIKVLSALINYQLPKSMTSIEEFTMALLYIRWMNRKSSKMELQLKYNLLKFL